MFTPITNKRADYVGKLNFVLSNPALAREVVTDNALEAGANPEEVLKYWEWLVSDLNRLNLELQDHDSHDFGFESDNEVWDRFIECKTHAISTIYPEIPIEEISIADF